MTRTFITTTIPYVNGDPHVGFALEAVQADVLARHARRNGDVRLLSGTDGRITIEPVSRRNEVLGFLDGGLHDFSVSRTAERARGWGIPVPGDPDQVIYVWFDALGNYINSLGYGTGDERFDHWWTGADRRVHVLGKGVLRFHAVYWPAILLSAGLELPTHLFVHDYLTVNGSKISKSAGTAISPVDIVDEYGVDALRWWLLRDVPRVGDADFTVERLELRAREDLAGGFGNVVNRVVTMIHRFRDGVAPESDPDADAETLLAACRRAPALIAAALAVPDFRAATSALRSIVDEANRYIEDAAPWRLAKTADPRLDRVLATLLYACRTLAVELEPFLPDAAARIAAQTSTVGGRLPPPAKVFEAAPPKVGTV